MNDIKLIVTDRDGTFLNSQYEVSPDFPDIYEEWKKEYSFRSGKRQTNARNYAVFCRNTG